ncbi:hypothetical protein F4801DRAFT_580317 [Xylaria longipes]|nr:hypothetical protein F4801DRAFT_580317 [Xylaria longipes]
MATDNSIGDNYAPNWLPYFSLDGDIFCDFDVECQICNKRLAITELADGEDIEDFCVLPCGHAFGLFLSVLLRGKDYFPSVGIITALTMPGRQPRSDIADSLIVDSEIADGPIVDSLLGSRM